MGYEVGLYTALAGDAVFFGARRRWVGRRPRGAIGQSDRSFAIGGLSGRIGVVRLLGPGGLAGRDERRWRPGFQDKPRGFSRSP